MSWDKELAKPENDEARSAGDVAAIVAKYRASKGEAVWRAAPMGEVLSLIGSTAATWSASNWTALKRDHVSPAGNVKLELTATRDFMRSLVSAGEWVAISDANSTVGSLADSLGLSQPTKKAIAEHLSALTDTPQYEYHKQHETMRLIRAKLHKNALMQTSHANLLIINAALGVK